MTSTSASHISNTESSRIPLLNGHAIPRLGLGTWPMLDKECADAVRDAARIGYRLFDTSFQYQNEEAVGRGLAASGIAREELFITSKFNKESHSVDGVSRAYDDSLRRLNVDYLDLFLCHWPVPALGQYVEAWKGLVKLLNEGRVKAIGVSNFKPTHLRKIIDATGVVPDLNQIQLDPTLARTEPRTVHEELGIVTESWSPLGRGSQLRENPLVVVIAERLGKTPAQVILRWHVQQNLIPVPKSSDPARLKENLSVFDFALTVADRATLNSLDLGEAAARDSDSPENGH